MNREFRIAQEDDFEMIASIFKKAINNMALHFIDQWDEFYPTKEILQSDISSRQMHVMTLNNRIVSVVVVNEEQSPEYESGDWKDKKGKIAVIHRLCVDPDFQHSGIGKDTVLLAEKMLAKKGYTSIRLDVFTQNFSALKLYRRLKYTQVGEVTFRKGLFYLFEKRIVEETGE